MTTKLAEIKEMIFKLPPEEINQLINEITETIATKDFMKLAETGFQEWNDPEENIYNNETEN
jgi:predicted metal-dependent TIM-barrel fold hydrolase